MTVDGIDGELVDVVAEPRSVGQLETGEQRVVRRVPPVRRDVQDVDALRQRADGRGPWRRRRSAPRARRPSAARGLADLLLAHERPADRRRARPASAASGRRATGEPQAWPTEAPSASGPASPGSIDHGVPGQRRRAAPRPPGRAASRDRRAGRPAAAADRRAPGASSPPDDDVAQGRREVAGGHVEVGLHARQQRRDRPERRRAGPPPAAPSPTTRQCTLVIDHEVRRQDGVGRRPAPPPPRRGPPGVGHLARALAVPRLLADPGAQRRRTSPRPVAWRSAVSACAAAGSLGGRTVVTRVASARARSDHSKTTSGRPSASASRSPANASRRPCPTSELCRSRLPNDDCHSCSSSSPRRTWSRAVARRPLRGRHLGAHLASEQPDTERRGGARPDPSRSRRRPPTASPTPSSACAAATVIISASCRSPSARSRPASSTARAARRRRRRPGLDLGRHRDRLGAQRPRLAPPLPEPPLGAPGHRGRPARVVPRERAGQDQLDLGLALSQPPRAVGAGRLLEGLLGIRRHPRRDQHLGPVLGDHGAVRRREVLEQRRRGLHRPQGRHQVAGQQPGVARGCARPWRRCTSLAGLAVEVGRAPRVLLRPLGVATLEVDQPAVEVRPGARLRRARRAARSPGRTTPARPDRHRPASAAARPATRRGRGRAGSSPACRKRLRTQRQTVRRCCRARPRRRRGSA